MPLVALGVVSAANTPLWLRSFAEDDEPRRLYSLIYCALDAVEERLAEPKKGEAFLGVLGPADEYLVYGYVSCTRTKFFFVLDEELREADVRDAFKHLHAAYVDAVSNPFAAASSPLCSRSFERAARGIRDSLGRKRLV